MNQKKQQSQYIFNQQRRLKWTIRNINETIEGLKSRGKIKASKSREKEIRKLHNELKSSLTLKNREHLKPSNGPKIKFKKIKHVSKDIAWAHELKKSFGEVTLFSDACFHIMGGERVGIIGPNGSGKTTLINMLLGNDKNYEGFLRLGEWVKYSYMGQEVVFDNENLTMLQVISAKSGLQERPAKDYLAQFQFYGDEVNKTIEVLSGGERVRLYLACVMLEDADCLILDEPTNHLDVPTKDAVEAALKEFRGTTIAITHDRYYLTHCVGKIIEIENGKITTYEGNYDFYKQIKYGTTEEGPEEKSPPAKKEIPKQNKEKRNLRNKTENTNKLRQELETLIVDLEQQLKEMEGLFDKSTPVEKYREYDNLQKEIDILYTKWSDLIT